jgi:predicted nucleic acid-binding protein
MSGFVLDCSIAVAWCFDDEASDNCDALLEKIKEEGAIVPTIWHLELGNVMIQAERRGRISSAEISNRLELLALLPINTDHDMQGRALREVLMLARAERLTTYDAAYLELAIRQRLPLASKDKRLRSAAINQGVHILPV